MTSSSCAKQGPMAIKEPGSSCNSCPPPARYEDIVNDPKLFMATLEKLHVNMRTKFMIPIIGGRELDLHRLFVEVTSRGGIDKIIKERKWKEVTAVFNFPSTATNASFVLRKYYNSLLLHFEQIYYFKTKVPAEPLQSPSITPLPSQGSVQPTTDVQAAVIQELRNNTSTIPGARSAPLSSSSSESPLIGVIDGKFDGGYLISVSIGSEKLKGVVFEPPHQDLGHQVPPPFNNVVTNNAGNTRVATGVRRRRRRKKSEIKRRDPAHPKPNRSGYNFFFAEQHARLKPLHPGKDREISRMIGELWNKLNEPERAVYQEKALKDKERYRVEMEGYRERLRTGQIISDAVPLQQRLPVPDAEMVDVDADHSKLDETGGDTPENNSSSDGSDFDMEASTEVVGGLGADSTTSVGLETTTSAEEPTFGASKSQENIEDDQVEKVSCNNMIVDRVVVEKADGESLSEKQLLPNAEN